MTDTTIDFIEEKVKIQLKINVFKIESKYNIHICIETPDIFEEDEHDIVLCLDNSGSMGASADRPGTEVSGLNILDILIHGVKTIINSCTLDHKIGIIKFSNYGEVICSLTKVNESGKKSLIDSLQIQPNGCTNLFDGIIKSYKMLEDRSNKKIKSSIILFTDGEPNQDPPNGYINELRLLKEQNKGKYICPINIYTFGNNVDSQLSDEITRETGGTYGFMPDSSFIGDLLSHKIASIRSSIALNSILKVEITNVKEWQINNSVDYIMTSNKSIQINVGDILYGQNRNFVFSVELENDEGPNIFASLHYNEESIQHETFDQIDINSFDYQNMLYNQKRHEIVDMISFLINYIDCRDQNSANKEFNKFLDSVITFTDERFNKMKEDLLGQIRLSILDQYYNKWGKHYLLSLRRAYQIEQTNNFKDFGVQHFGGKLFNKILDGADDIFTKMPPPQANNTYSNTIITPVNMTTFNSRYNNSCFHGLSLVKMSDNSEKKVEDIIKGDIIKLANGNTSVIECVIKTIFETNYDNLITLNSLHITPYHPVNIDGKWYFPKDLPFVECILECNAIYSFVLNDRGNGSGILIGNIECATLGHGLTEDVINHPFFGTEKVINNLKESTFYKNGLIILNENCVKRDVNNIVYRIIL